MSEKVSESNEQVDLRFRIPETFKRAIVDLFTLKPETGKIFNNEVEKFVLSAIQKAILAYTTEDMNFQQQWDELEKKFEELLAKFGESVKK
ncbi:MAG: hypothetical protein ACFFD4_34710 [Candidatus Odinarchaeota archaeon]